ncbi:MAG: PIN domain-containing protein [Candidatus Methanoperedens sp.]|nr:PIN domain-containing protein [Candidatus Methanoperedens sp.]
MNGNCKFLLDTNIIIALFGNDISIKSRLAHTDEVFISSTILGELYFGAHKSSKVKTNLARIEEFASCIAVLSCDIDTARISVRLREES